MTAPEQPKRRGRPPKAPEERADALFALRMTHAQRDKLQRLATAQGAKLGIAMSDAGWVLWSIDRAKI